MLCWSRDEPSNLGIVGLHLWFSTDYEAVPSSPPPLATLGVSPLSIWPQFWISGPDWSDEPEFKKVAVAGVDQSLDFPDRSSSTSQLFWGLGFSELPFWFPLVLIHSPYCFAELGVWGWRWQCFSLWPSHSHWKQKVGSLSYLKVTHIFSPSRLMMLPPFRNGLLRSKSTLTLMKRACSNSHNLLSVSM